MTVFFEFFPVLIGLEVVCVCERCLRSCFKLVLNELKCVLSRARPAHKIKKKGAMSQKNETC